MIVLTRSELNKKYNINKNTWSRRHDDLLEYLNDYMCIKEREDNGRYYYDIDQDILPQEIPPIPRKSNMKEKKDEYKKFTIGALGVEYKPNSKAKVARDAIDKFGCSKYGHSSVAAVVRRYVGPVMEEEGEHSNHMVWVDCFTYEILDTELVNILKQMFKDEKLSEEEMANAFIKQQQGEDISEEKSGYKKVIDRFKEEYGVIPIKVYEWKLKT